MCLADKRTWREVNGEGRGKQCNGHQTTLALLHHEGECLMSNDYWNQWYFVRKCGLHELTRFPMSCELVHAREIATNMRGLLHTQNRAVNEELLILQCPHGKRFSLFGHKVACSRCKEQNIDFQFDVNDHITDVSDNRVTGTQIREQRMALPQEVAAHQRFSDVWNIEIDPCFSLRFGKGKDTLQP